MAGPAEAHGALDSAADLKHGEEDEARETGEADEAPWVGQRVEDGVGPAAVHVLADLDPHDVGEHEADAELARTGAEAVRRQQQVHPRHDHVHVVHCEAQPEGALDVAALHRTVGAAHHPHNVEHHRHHVGEPKGSRRKVVREVAHALAAAQGYILRRQCTRGEDAEREGERLDREAKECEVAEEPAKSSGARQHLCGVAEVPHPHLHKPAPAYCLEGEGEDVLRAGARLAPAAAALLDQRHHARGRSRAGSGRHLDALPAAGTGATKSMLLKLPQAVFAVCRLCSLALLLPWLDH
mmetsp:Transcript_9455/g.24011  ORF Transcript_9455/g.24011 Transcript_9455/m.24011 type:complete len:296 (-) Transcript_9455:20-907(-)